METEYQLEAFKQFKKNISDILTPHDTDAILLKWLRARNYNPKKAELYFREMHAFQQTYELDTICETFVKPEMVEKYEYTSFLGFAKDGSVIRYADLGRGDHLGFILSQSIYQLGKYCSYLMAHDIALQRKQNERTGKEMNEITYIFDLEGFCITSILHKCVLETAFDFGIAVQEYYPEIWGNILCINVPCYFDRAYNMFKPIMKLSVIHKIQVAAKETTPQLLLKYIDADVLPAFLGGKRTDSMGNPRCTEFLKFGRKVPTEFYASKCVPLLSPKEPGVHELWIPARGGVYNHVMVARKPGTIRIEFRTENGSIHLKLLFREFSKDQEVPGVEEYLDERDEKTNVKLVSPSMWIQSHLAPVDDSCRAPWPGIYILRFSNSHSLFGSRRLIYRIQLIES